MSLFIVTATQSYQRKQSTRAFIEPTESKAKKTKRELTRNGWVNASIVEVDVITLGQVILNTIC